MSRDDGFDIADVATGLYDDPKVKKLWRALGDETRMTHAMTLHMATLLASWRHGTRVTVDEAVPVWLTPDASLVTELQAAGLLDRQARIPARSWKGWFHPVVERREAVRERWRRANDKRRGGDRDVTARSPRGNRAFDGSGTATVRTDRSGPSSPSGPTGRSSPRAGARDDAPSNDGATGARGGPELLRETMAAIAGGKR